MVAKWPEPSSDGVSHKSVEALTRSKENTNTTSWPWAEEINWGQEEKGDVEEDAEAIGEFSG